MVVSEPERSIMDGIENTGDLRLHDHRLRLKQRFDIIRKLGQGTYGKVQLGINKKTGQEVAIKTIKKCKIETEADLVRIRREVQIMSSVRHPNIVHIYEVFENSEKMILVMEYCAGGELYDYLSQQKVLQEDEARRLFRQIATAVYYCHKHKICHRDLKLENVLLDENGNAKIADFGLSNVFEERRLLSTFCGSPLYASPEIVKGTPYIGPEVDCWSLGVLLYTLVYGAMPFDGSNFKRLVKQISMGDYFEPKNPSTASPLIREMLTVDPVQRADITHICDSQWVNKGSDVSCLELAEALANETPVRLDLLLSLVPPPSIGDDKLVVTDEVANIGQDGSPSRSMSVANVDNSAERRILEMVAEGGADAIKPSPTRTVVTSEQPKRKLETTVSMDSAPSQRKKERSIRSNSIVNQISPQNDTKMSVSNIENNGEVKAVDSLKNDVETSSKENSEVQLTAAKQESTPVDAPKSPIQSNMSQLTLEIAKEAPCEPVKRQSPEKPPTVIASATKEPKLEIKAKESVLKEKNVASKTAPVLKKRTVASSLKDGPIKSTPPKEKSPPRKSIEKDIAGRVVVADKKTEEKKVEETPAVDSQVKPKPERRRSRILDTAEKLNNLSLQPNATPVEVPQPAPVAKPKKVVIPGISVGSFKEQFERRASLTSGGTVAPAPEPKKTLSKPTTPVSQAVSKPALVKKVHSVDSEHPAMLQTQENKDTTNVKLVNIGIEPALPPKEEPPKPIQEIKKPAIVEVHKVPKALHKTESLREATKMESDLSLEAARKNLQQSMALLNQARNESQSSISTNDSQNERQRQLKNAREIISNAIFDDGKRNKMVGKPPVPYGSGGRSFSGTLSLNSMNSLPSSPPTSPPYRSTVRESPVRTFRTEVQHRMDDVRNKYGAPPRGGSVERIIPIHFTEEAKGNLNTSSSGQMPYQRNNSVPYRFSSLPRGCTSDNESEISQQPSTPSTPVYHSKPEPIKKSPREFIIPIAVEGKGYVTPRQGSLEPSDTPTKLTPSNINFMSRFPKPRRLGSIVSGGESEDDDDTHMHRLRSSRRTRNDVEKDSVSSGEEDEDERFEFLTADNLFSTLLDRVRSLTNRLNGEQGTGFPQHHQSLFNNFNSPFFNRREGPSWRRSTSRDIASDFDSLFPSHPTFPRGSRKSRQSTDNNRKKTNHTNAEADDESRAKGSADEERLDLSDLDLSKMEISEKDMEMLSGLTPALSRRLQKQLLDHLPPAAARSLRRTLSLNNPPDKVDQKYHRSHSATKTTNDRISEEAKTSNHFTAANDEDSSSMSYSSALDKTDRENNNYDYSESILSRDRSGNSLDLNHSLSETPKSVLSKYLSPERYIPDNYRSRNDDFASYDAHSSILDDINSKINRRRSVKTPPTETTPRRRISRFLRPDFFDTPWEESVYVREKRNKENETQRILREIRERRNRSGASSPISPSMQQDIYPFFENATTNCLSPHSPSTPNRSRSVTPFYPILDNIKETDSNSHEPKPSNQPIINNSISSDTNGIKSDVKPKESKLIRPKSFPYKQNDTLVKAEIKDDDNVPDNVQPKLEKKESKMIRPRSYPATTPSPEKKPNIPNPEIKPLKCKITTDNGNVANVPIKTVSPPKDDNGNTSVTFNISLPAKKPEIKVNDEDKEKKPSPVKKKIVVKKKTGLKTKASTKETNSTENGDVKKESEVKIKKKSMLQSLGQKFEKLRSDSFSKNDKEASPDKLGRSVKGFDSNRSLREHSVPTSHSEPTTESGLIKRATTETDLQALNGKDQKKSVNRVFGLFKKDKNGKANVSNTDVSVVDDDKPVIEVEAQPTTSSEKPKRPTSLLLNGIGKRVQACYNGAATDSLITKPDKNGKIVESSPPKTDDGKNQKKGLRLDFSRLPKINQGIFNKRNSLDMSKTDDEAKSDKVEANGDATPVDLTPDFDVKPNDHYVQSDVEIEGGSPETENIIDRIRRKSFYSRFNEKKNRRKSSLVGPGAKEYIPSARINPQCDTDNLYRYDLSPTLPSKYVSSPLNYEHRSLLDNSDGLSPSSPRIRNSIDPFFAHKNTERIEKKYPETSYDNSQYSLPRYSRTLSYFDNYDSKPSTSESKSSRSRYGRTLSLLSPGIYATYSPRSHARNSAILLKDAADIETNTESILSKIRNRKNAAKNNYDDGASLDAKFRSNQMHDGENDTTADEPE